MAKRRGGRLLGDCAVLQLGEPIYSTMSRHTRGLFRIVSVVLAIGHMWLPFRGSSPLGAGGIVRELKRPECNAIATPLQRRTTASVHVHVMFTICALVSAQSASRSSGGNLQQTAINRHRRRPETTPRELGGGHQIQWLLSPPTATPSASGSPYLR